MATTFTATVDSRLAADGFSIVQRVADIAEDYAGRGFSEPDGPMFEAIDEMCRHRMEHVEKTAVAVYQQHSKQGSVTPHLRSELVAYLQSALTSLAESALHSRGRQPDAALKARFERKVDMALARAKNT